ncbi:hypothetical protein B0F90DRAFT_1748290 [Multifurca ochricompacta]|uniref:Uncharacterized protein n=1 Tax=Multifurca ochricompacta TaxID=376703 RepID=A0AAD4QK00_9AGAM|nr:hypothetical protein B0F90DRAFT_1748290 [Multifurca ochricompacta]
MINPVPSCCKTLPVYRASGIPTSHAAAVHTCSPSWLSSCTCSPSLLQRLIR